MIGFDILDDVHNDANWVYQNDGKLYCRYIQHWMDGSTTSTYDAHNVNIIYV